MSTVILAIIIFGFSVKVIYSLIFKKNSCQSCHTSCAVKEKKE